MVQTWNGSICIREALQISRFDARPNWQPNEANPWRTPTKYELRTLVFCSNGNPARFKDSDERCYGDHQVPTIVQPVFPNTPSTRFWSISPHDTIRTSRWAVDFSNGQADTWAFGNYAIRRVRDGQQR